jgi:hypothetical protein
MNVWLWPGAENHNLPTFGLASGVSRYLTVLQRVQIRDRRSVLFVRVWTKILGVIFHFPRSSSGPLLLRLYCRWRIAAIVFSCKSGPVACHQSPSNVMPHLMAVSSLLASLSTAGTWLAPRYAVYFQFLTDGNEQYAISNIPSAKEISSVKNGTKKGTKMCEERIQKPLEFLNQGRVSWDFFFQFVPPRTGRMWLGHLWQQGTKLLRNHRSYGRWSG